MRALVIGSGGREHALSWKLAQSPMVEKIFTAPGNPGTEAIEKNQNVPISATDIDALVAFASSEGIDFTIVGPEQPLADGLVDEFQKRNLFAFGPTQKASQLESSKRFAKDLMAQIGIPTAAYQTLESRSQAEDYIRSAKYPLVLKADGLAAGKGVRVCANVGEAEDFVEEVMGSHIFGNAGERIVAEEFLEGQEASFLVMAKGQDFVPLASAQDHKRLEEGDQGPNTGGMGAYSPAPIFTTELQKQSEDKIVRPILKKMEEMGAPFCGFLYVGLMLTPEGPKVLEFNVRFGDPEAQAVLPRLESDLAQLILACKRGRLGQENTSWKSGASMTVVLASKGYPRKPEKGQPIEGLDQAADRALIFHAGTKNESGKTVTSGGRVLAATGLGDNLEEAKRSAYEAVEAIRFSGKVFRRDIGWRALSTNG